MQQSASHQPMVHWEGPVGPFLPHLPVAGHVLECLDGDKTFTMSDELWLLTHDFFKCLEALYFYDSWEVQCLYHPGQWDWNLEHWRELEVYHNGLVRLKEDVSQRRNLYRYFKRKSNALTDDTTVAYNNQGNFYSEVVFYETFQPFFDFCIRYWSCIEHGIQCMEALNDGESYTCVEKDTLHAVHDTWMKYEKYGFDIRYLPSGLRKWKKLPFSLHFRYAWKKTTFQSMWNITRAEFVELQILAQKSKEESIKREEREQEARYTRWAEKARRWEPLWPDDDIEF